MGIPVISIGIPTVIDVATIITDLIDIDMLESKNDFENIKKIVNGGNFVVTPTEIDEIVSKNAKLIASALNIALQM